MDIDKIGEVLRIYCDKYKYNSGFVSFKRNFVSNDYSNVRGGDATFYGTVFDEHHNRSYTAMININTNSRTISNISCDCQNVFNERGIMVCSHMAAVALKGIDNIRKKNKEDFSEGDIIINPTVTLNITQSRDGFLGGNLLLDGIDKNEYQNIFKSYKDNYKYHLLPDNSYVDLRDNDLQQVLKVIDILGIEGDLGKFKIPNNKAMFLEEIIDEEELFFLEGRKYINNVVKKFKKNSLQTKTPESLINVLRDYQVDGFKFFSVLSSFGFGGILADEMGLGKTIQTLAFLKSQKNKKSIVIVPTSLIFNWKDEFEKFTPDIKLGIVYGSKKLREKLIHNICEYDVILTTYSTYRNDIEKYEDIKFDYCVIDEAQNIKNPDSIITKSIKKINADVKFALTGTPVENNVSELWSIFDFIMPGYLYNRRKFEKIFGNNSKYTEDLKKLIRPFMIRRTKKEVIEELPDKIEQKFYIQMDKEHKRAYKSFVKLIKKRILEKNEDNMTVLSYLTKLRQLSIAPELVVKNYNGENSKINMLLDIIKENENRKILVFSQFTKVLNLIGKRLNDENITFLYLDGKIDAKKRLELVKQFNERDDKRILLISLKAGGTGLNLTSASMVIHFDPWWNPAVEDQASDRVHRFGQRNIVNIVKLITKNTVEENVVALQERKKELIENIINNNLENEISLNKLTRDEIIELFEEV